ncbi:MAG TPA: hypothetical protein VFD58_22865 [Blastocatellia bacterium]|nr:hypothetical protein [Blastocatellia bacterium]
MSSVLNSPQERQRLMTRLDYLLRQYENLNLVAKALGEMADGVAPARPSETDLRSRLEQQGALLAGGEIDAVRRALGQIGSTLYEAQEQLHQFDGRVSVCQIRQRFQQADSSREEIGALLQFLLSKLHFSEEDLDKIDFLTTCFYAQSVKAGGGFGFEDRVRQEYEKMLEYAGITKTDVPDPEGMESLEFLREEIASVTSLQQLTARQTLDRLRAFKAGLQNRRLHPDVMIELARVNMLAGRRFDELASRESQRIDKLATRLISAGFSEVEESKGEGPVLVEEVWKRSLYDARQLNDDYRNNRRRIERLAEANDTLARVHESLGLEEPVTNPAVEGPATDAAEAVTSQPAATFRSARQFEASEVRVAEFNLTPKQFERDLCARLQQIAEMLREQPAAEAGSGAEIELSFGASGITLGAWEAAAFQRNYPRLRTETASLGSLLRLTVALMAELKEKQELIYRWLMSPDYPSEDAGSVRYLELFGRQTVEEVEACLRSAGDALPREVCDQLQRTQHKLSDACVQFSARIQEAMV